MSDDQKWYVAHGLVVDGANWHIANPCWRGITGDIETMCGASFSQPHQAVLKLCKADMLCASCKNGWADRQAKRKHVTRRCGPYEVDVTGAPEDVARALAEMEPRVKVFSQTGKGFLERDWHCRFKPGVLEEIAVVHSAWATESEANEHARKVLGQ